MGLVYIRRPGTGCSSMPGESGLSAPQPAIALRWRLRCRRSWKLGWRGYNSRYVMKRGIIGLLSVALMFGQNPKQKAAPKAAPAPEDQSRITVDVTRVNLLYTVTDK